MQPDRGAAFVDGVSGFLSKVQTLRASAWSSSQAVRRLRIWLPGLIALCALVLVYAGTLHGDIYGRSNNNYMDDSGEIQVALNIWGTIHFTGYPLYTILSALLVQVARAIGLAPAAAASATSAVWSLLALAILYLVVLRLTGGERVLAALTILAIGLVETFWIHSVIAEVYSFSLLLMSATLLVALRLAGRWSERDWLIAVALLGASAAHHRLLILLAPCVLLPVLPDPWRALVRRPALILYSGLAFFLPFLAYLYLPLRAMQGSPWVYGQPDTWPGFWFEFLGREAIGRVKLPEGSQEWIANLSQADAYLRQQVPLVLALAGVAGLIWMTRRRTWIGFSWLMSALSFAAFVFLFPTAVWVPAALMPFLLLSALGGAYLLRRRATRWGAWAGLLALSVALFATNLPRVWDLVRDPFGDEVIQTLALVSASDVASGREVVALPWGGAYFAAAYGLYVTQELDGLEIVDHRADLRSIVDRTGKILTLSYLLDRWPLRWWKDRLGEAHYSTAAPGVAVISRERLYQDIAPQAPFDLETGLRIRAAEIAWAHEDELWVTVYWEALDAPESDYRVAVHLLSEVPPEGAHHILAQADSVHPVSGRYPVTLWETGEVVRDDYGLPVPPGTHPAGVRIGMYQIVEGSFVNTPWLYLELPPDSGAQILTD
jgi:hypothetical protein